MKVLALGGTGAMGVHVCRLLANAGHNVFCTSRRHHESSLDGLRFLEGDAKDERFLAGLLSHRWDAIVDFMVWSTAEFKARCLRFLDATTQYVFVSSYRVYADSTVITEDSPRLLDSCDDPAYLLTDEYALSKARCENLLFECGNDNWTIARPAITYDGSGRLQLGVYESDVWLWRALNGIPVPFPKEMLSRQATMTWGGDVAKMISLLVGNPSAKGEAFTVSTSEHHSWSRVADFYREVIPLPILPCSLTAFERAKGSVYQIRYDRMYNRVIDNSKVLSATGLAQSEIVSMETGLARQLESYLRSTTGPAVGAIGTQARLDRMIGGTPSMAPMLHSGVGSGALAKYCARRFLS